MTPLPLFYFCHGIDGQHPNGWHWQWECRVNDDDSIEARADSYEYDMTSMQRGSRRKAYADILAQRIRTVLAHPSHYSALNLAAHSEGTDIVTLALQQPGTRARHLHLMGGACDASFKKNGLLRAMREGRVEHVWVYVSPDDETLWAASSFWLWGPALGKAATEAEAWRQMEIPPDVRDRVTLVFRPGYRHCDWVYDHGAETLAAILAASLPAPAPTTPGV